MKVLLIFSVVILFVSCSPKQADQPSDHTHTSMTVTEQPGSLDIMLTDSQIKLANITTRIIKAGDMATSINVTGRLLVNQDKSEVVSSRVGGRIEKLFVKEVGRPITKGEPLYQLYSESLLTLQQEFLLALEQGDAFASATRNKLLLFGQTNQQVDRLEQSQVVQPLVTFLAPASGLVQEISKREGAYVQEGELLYKIDNINTLWVEAELYSDESSFVKKGENVMVYVPGNPEPIESKVIFSSPAYSNNTQVTIIRALINNQDNLLIPGMPVEVSLGTTASQKLFIPSGAIIRDESGSHVYVKIAENTFQPRSIKTGNEAGSNIEVMGGLKEDEELIVTGTYLIYSEIILKQGIDPAISLTNKNEF